MNGMTVLVSPLNWGFGHAGRMIPVALELKKRGCEVIFAADVSLLEIAGRELPGIRLVETPGLRIRYSRRLPQYICIFLQLPRIIASALTEHRVLRRLVSEMNPSLIISDNRFGFYHRNVNSVYITHQLRIPFPWLLSFMEPLAAWLHRVIINRFDLCLVPDFPGEENLSGRLSHGVRLPRNIIYMGPLSRFATADIVEVSSSATAEGGEVPGSDATAEWNNRAPAGTTEDEKSVAANGSVAAPMTGESMSYPQQEGVAGSFRNPYVCLILSGPEPQRTLLLEKAAEALRGVKTVMLCTGPVPDSFGENHPDITFITNPAREVMRRVIASSSLVIARAGYSSVMELFLMGRGAVIIPTPGQTEQEYLGTHLNGQYGFITLRQGNLEQLPEIVSKFAVFTGNAEGYAPFATESSGADRSFAETLFKKAIDRLLEQKKK